MPSTREKIIAYFTTRRLIFAAIVILSIGLAGYLVYNRYYGVMPESAIHFLNDAAVPTSGQKVLIFSPHPDDESIGAGGFIYEAEKAGAEVKIVLVTDGDKHGLRDARYKEFTNATGILGVKPSDLVYLGHQDGNLQKTDKNLLESEFKSQIDSFKPDFVLCTSVSDTHPDHSETGKMVEKAVGDMSYQGKIYEFLIHWNNWPEPKKLEEDKYLLPPSSLVTFDREWQRVMLDHDAETAKLNAVLAYKTQVKNPIVGGVALGMVRQNDLFSIEAKE